MESNNKIEKEKEKFEPSAPTGDELEEGGSEEVEASTNEETNTEQDGGTTWFDELQQRTQATELRLDDLQQHIEAKFSTMEELIKSHQQQLMKFIHLMDESIDISKKAAVAKGFMTPGGGSPPPPKPKVTTIKPLLFEASTSQPTSGTKMGALSVNDDDKFLMEGAIPTTPQDTSTSGGAGISVVSPPQVKTVPTTGLPQLFSAWTKPAASPAADTSTSVNATFRRVPDQLEYSFSEDVRTVTASKPTADDSPQFISGTAKTPPD